MRQILAVALVGMGLSFSASAAVAGEHESPFLLQLQAPMMVGTGPGSSTPAIAGPLTWPIWHDGHDHGR